MPQYDGSTFKTPPKLLVPGQNLYLLGSYKQTQAPTQIQVASVAIAGNVATVMGSVTGGEVPLVGSLISIRGTQTGGGVFNVTNVALASVLYTAATAAITVTFALVGANVAAAADSGRGLVPVPEVAEATVAGTASIACTPQNNETDLTFARQVSVAVNGTGSYMLQGADFDQAAEYTNVGACSGNAVTQFGPNAFRFYRVMPTIGGAAVVRITG